MENSINNDFNSSAPTTIASIPRPSITIMPKRPASLNLSRPSSLLKKSAFGTKGLVKKSKVQHRPSWNVAQDVSMLPEIPFFHVHTQTTTIVPNEKPQTIADRIVSGVGEISAVGSFDNELAKAIIHTMKGDKISIQMFQKDGAVLVEIDRVNGDVISFHHTAKILLQVAKNIPSSPTKSMEEIKVVTPPAIQGRSQIFAHAMEKAQSLLRKDRTDAVILGMESLDFLTDGESSSREITIGASKAILCNGNEYQEVKDFLFGCIMDEFDEETDVDSLHEHENRLFHSLKIIGNALSTNNEVRKDVQFNLDMEEMKDLLARLIGLMKQKSAGSIDHVHRTFQVARCASYILDLSQEMNNVAFELGLAELASDFLEGGSSKHSMLSETSEAIILSLKKY